MSDIPDWLALTMLAAMVSLLIAASIVQLVAFFRLGDQFLNWWRDRRK